jgi:NTE family protein
MLRVLLSWGVLPDFVVGASVGAINAAYFACVPNLEGAGALERIWLGLRRADIFPFSLASLFGLIKHPGNVVDPGGLRCVVEANLPCVLIEEAKIPLHIMATNQHGEGDPSLHDDGRRAKPGTDFVTSRMLGCFRDNQELRREFVLMTA